MDETQMHVGVTLTKDGYASSETVRYEPAAGVLDAGEIADQLRRMGYRHKAFSFSVDWAQLWVDGREMRAAAPLNPAQRYTLDGVLLD